MSAKANKKVIVIGNGPSLRGFDFGNLSSVDSIGMNAAYRYWERISWFPTHYTCLDDQLIETHAEKIYELIKTCKVKNALLIAKILDFFPDLLGLSNVFYLESFHSARHKRESKRGIPYISSRFFRESDSSKVTTGAYAVRFAAHLGYNQIGILGVDLKYTEELPESKSLGGIKLVMAETPISNPNYFFDDYQKAGDKYNVPNPSSHGRNLHVAAFEVLANDYVQFGWNAKIQNVNKSSILHEKGIFPFLDIKDFLAARRLSALVIPTTPREALLLENNFKLWDLPQFLPSIYTDLDDKPDLIIAFSNYESESLTQQILTALDGTTHLKHCFAHKRIVYAELDENIDYYEKDYQKIIGEAGYKSGPNEQFFRIIHMLSDLEGFIFYMETDCVPLKQGWLDSICELAKGDHESWVIGSYYQGISPISNRFKYHLNGNALYRVGSNDFQTFINQMWKPLLQDILKSTDPTMAYDCVISYLFTGADSETANNAEWKFFQDYASRFRATSLIKNISATVDNQLDAKTTIKTLLINSPSSVIVHGSIFRDLAKKVVSGSSRDFSFPYYWAEVPSAESSLGKDGELKVVNDTVPPRILIIDKYPVDHPSATGQVKRAFLGDWNPACCLQVWESGDVERHLHVFQLGTNFDESEQKRLSVSQALDYCLDFKPDVIYFRPIESPSLFEVARLLLDRSGLPLIVHMMDDWPERLKLNDILGFNAFDPLLRSILARASRLLSICQEMSDVFAERYGGDWIPLANGVDPSDFLCRDWNNSMPSGVNAPFVIRYMGALADDMTYQSICEVAQAVSAINVDLSIHFEIYTMDWCRAKAENDIGSLPGIFIYPTTSNKRYRQLLSEADALVIAYNFDQASLAYTRLSLANKLPECMISGAPIIAYGPAECATIKYLKELECAQVVTESSHRILVNALTALVEDFELRKNLSKSAFHHALKLMSKSLVQAKFKSIVSECAENRFNSGALIAGPYLRECHASLDETACIAQLFKTELTGSLMVDVGAHHGSSLASFLDRGWSIYAFEPDNNNRSKLLDRLSKHSLKNNVFVDSRCISNSSASNLPFFASEQSTGISGLSAFHQTHQQSQLVNVTTLREFFGEKNLSSVDFLKIDTEGHDLFVLEGFPWEVDRPGVIECEFEDAKTRPLGYCFHDLARFLIEKDYIVYVSEWHPIVQYGISHDWHQLRRYPCELSSDVSWGNLLAFRSPVDEMILREAASKVLSIKALDGLVYSGDLASLRGIPVFPVSPEDLDLIISPGDCFKLVGSNRWNYNLNSGTQRLWIARVRVPGPTASRTFIGTLRLTLERAMSLNISIGRHGQTMYEGRKKSIVLEASMPRVITLATKFEQSHPALKLQIEVDKIPGFASSDLTVDCVGIAETVDSVQSRLGMYNFNFKTANLLFCRQDYFSSLAIYCWLYAQKGLSVYGDNAVRTARLLGMSWVHEPNDLSWLR